MRRVRWRSANALPSRSFAAEEPSGSAHRCPAARPRRDRRNDAAQPSPLVALWAASCSERIEGVALQPQAGLFQQLPGEKPESRRHHDGCKQVSALADEAVVQEQVDDRYVVEVDAVGDVVSPQEARATSTSPRLKPYPTRSKDSFSQLGSWGNYPVTLRSKTGSGVD